MICLRVLLDGCLDEVNEGVRWEPLWCVFLVYKTGKRLWKGINETISHENYADGSLASRDLIEDSFVERGRDEHLCTVCVVYTSVYDMFDVVVVTWKCSIDDVDGVHEDGLINLHDWGTVPSHV